MKQRIRWLAFVCAVCVACAAAAQDNFPTKAVTIIVPQTPGGANDVLARLLAQKLTENLGQQFIIENRPGEMFKAQSRAIARPNSLRPWSSPSCRSGRRS